MPLLDPLLSLFRQKISASFPADDCSQQPHDRISADVTVLKTLVIVYDPLLIEPPAKNYRNICTGTRSRIWQRDSCPTSCKPAEGWRVIRIVQRLDVDDFPAKVDGYRYDAQTYLDVMRGASTPYMPQEADYHAIIERFNILGTCGRNEIDEVWIFNFPHAGFYESIMGGPGAFWCNAPPLRNTDGQTTFRHHGILLRTRGG
jgi:hypothetical protein